MKIRAYLPPTIENDLIKFLGEIVDLFACSPEEMSRIYLSNVNPEAKAVSQKRCHQSPEKAQAARETVEGLLQGKVISEISYTQWLSNMVLLHHLRNRNRDFC